MVSPFGPCCCGGDPIDCPCCDDSPDEWVIDLGSTGAFTNNRCNQCSNIGGEYTLTRFGEVFTDCEWRFCAEDFCPDSEPTCVENWDLSITLRMFRHIGGTSCSFRVRIELNDITCVNISDDDEDCADKSPTQRTYLVRSSEGSLDCIDDLNLAIPLDVIFSPHVAGNACGGTPNDPITLKAA